MFYIFWDPRENPPLTNLSKINGLATQMFCLKSPLMSHNLLKLRHLLQLHSNTDCDHTTNIKKITGPWGKCSWETLGGDSAAVFPCLDHSDPQPIPQKTSMVEITSVLHNY